MNIDQLNNADLGDTASAAFGLVDSLQRHPEAVQALAAGVLFVLLCEAKGITAQRVLEVVANVRRQAEDDPAARGVLLAIADYIGKELSHA